MINAPADCKRRFRAECPERTKRWRPSSPFRYCRLLAVSLTFSMSRLRAGVWFRNFALTFFPSERCFSSVSFGWKRLPMRMSPAPYKNASCVFKLIRKINPVRYVLRTPCTSVCRHTDQTISSPSALPLGATRFECHQLAPYSLRIVVAPSLCFSSICISLFSCLKHGAWLRIVSVRVPLNSRSFCIKVSLESSDFQMNRFASFLVSSPAACWLVVWMSPKRITSLYAPPSYLVR